ncbi:endonuclease [Caerostris extrusa]|uniref:Endonuclease n=1 Tax=Caerostris extrusa TaxID=172846 RepID=A0AAV4SA14_CAEEX|nr:endonuclease [Caerostris extrusa]
MCFPLHMVQKKEQFGLTLFDGFRPLNTQTVNDKYPISCIFDFTSELHVCEFFSHFDLVKAFHQISIAPEDIHKTAICSPFGVYESKYFQFGLCNANSTFQRFIDGITLGFE